MAAGGGRLKKTVMVLQIVALTLLVGGGTWVRAQVHHVVGGDRGWDPSTDVASWASGRIFRVGDKIWFAYSAAQESVAELKSKEEYESCDLTNPIKMYTNGIDIIPLAGEGARYFASLKNESCNNGLKLHVDVKPRQTPDFPVISTSESESESSATLTADAPATPSGSSRAGATSFLLLVGILIYAAKFSNTM